MTRHKEQHTILERLEEHGYKGIKERSKVRHLMNGIKGDKLYVVTTTILSSEEYRSDFGGCVHSSKIF